MSISPVGSARLSYTISMAVFLFFALLLALPRAYSLGVVILLLSSCYCLCKRPRLMLDCSDKILLCMLLAVFLGGLVTWLAHGDPLAEFDLTTRYLLVVPILLTLRVQPPRPGWVWAGLATGSVAAAGLAMWERTVEGAPRAFGFTGGIQFGDLALMMGILCAAGFMWARRQHSGRWWQLAMVVGVICGGYASLASGSRGGWVALPVVFVLFGIAYIRRGNRRRALLCIAVLMAVLAIAVATSSMVKSRYDEALSDIQSFQQGQTDTSIGNRFALWQALSAMTPERPWLGWAQRDYRSHLTQLVDQGSLSEDAAGLANSHNTFLEIWVHQGLITLIPVLGLLVAAFAGFAVRMRSADPITQAYATAGASLIACYVIFGQTQIMLGRNNTLTFFLVALIAFWCIMKNHASATDKR